VWKRNNSFHTFPQPRCMPLVRLGVRRVSPSATLLVREKLALVAAFNLPVGSSAFSVSKRMALVGWPLGGSRIARLLEASPVPSGSPEPHRIAFAIAVYFV
jgi:hypothetical protein